MKEIAVTSALTLQSLESELANGGPVLLDLISPPEGCDRLDLLRRVTRSLGPLVVRFSGVLKTPLAEVAGLAAEAEWKPGSLLDLRGALLTPFLWQKGDASLFRLIARHGPLIEPGELLSAHPGTMGRSPAALGLALWLIEDGRGSSKRLALARELAAFRFVMGLPDRAEGVKAFLEKRPSGFGW